MANPHKTIKLLFSFSFIHSKASQANRASDSATTMIEHNDLYN